jgi:hypothetical protein
MDGVPDYVASVSTQARQLVAGVDRPYEVGLRIWTIGMEGTRDEATRGAAWPIWLTWGSLTDRVDGLRGRERGAEEAAPFEMRRAASEWLAVADDQLGRVLLGSALHGFGSACEPTRNPDGSFTSGGQTPYMDPTGVPVL